MPQFLKDEEYYFRTFHRLMFEEEENIRSGRLLSETQILDQFVLKGPEKPTQKSGTAFVF